jgi:hypothetical protein
VAVPDRDILAEARIDDETPVLGAPSEAENIVADYNSTGHAWTPPTFTATPNIA